MKELPGHYRELLIEIGEDPQRKGLIDTPVRAAETMQYLCNGYTKSLSDVVEGALFASDTNEMVVVRDIRLHSLCEHHLLPFIGKAHVAYMPTGQVLGLPQVTNIVDMFARRLQSQERLTQQIAQAFEQVTRASGIAVVVEARHICAMMCDAGQQHSQMITSAMLGRFRTSSTARMEFLQLVGDDQ